MITFAGGRDRHRHALPREHAPVVGRQRQRGRLQPDLLQGGHGDRSASILYDARPARTRRAARARGRAAAFQRSLVKQFNTNYAQRRLLDRRAVEPDAVQPVLRLVTYDRPGIAYIALRQILGHGRLHQGAAADPARATAASQHHRAPARGRLPPVAAGARARACQRRLTSSSPSGSTPPTRRAAARTGRRSPVPAWTGPASTTRTAPAAELQEIPPGADRTSSLLIQSALGRSAQGNGPCSAQGNERTGVHRHSRTL